ncbi:hypothetical protein V5799_033431, partial [Amblyomma americanum]
MLRLRFTMKYVARPMKVPYHVIFLTSTVNFVTMMLNILQAAAYSILIFLVIVIITGSVAFVLFRVNSCTTPGTVQV